MVETWFSEHFAEACVPVSKVKWRKLVSDTTSPDGLRHRRVRMEPDIDLPEFLRRIVASEPIIYDELSTYDPKTRVLAFAVESKAKEQIRYTGRMQFTPSPKGARVLFQAGVQVDAPMGVSNIVASIVESNVEQGYFRIGDLLRRYLAGCRAEPSGATVFRASPDACVAAKRHIAETKAAAALAASARTSSSSPLPATAVSAAPGTSAAD